MRVRLSYAGLTRVSINSREAFSKSDGLPGQARQRHLPFFPASVTSPRNNRHRYGCRAEAAMISLKVAKCLANAPRPAGGAMTAGRGLLPTKAFSTATYPA